MFILLLKRDESTNYWIIILLILASCTEKKQRDRKSVAELFPPIKIIEWEKTPVVNGRHFEHAGSIVKISININAWRNLLNRRLGFIYLLKSCSVKQINL
jgi:hypothetical protein